MARSASLTPRPPRGFALVVAVLVVAAIAATTIVARGGFPWSAAGPGALSAPVRIQTLVSAHLACPIDPSFSPDGAHVSVLGVLNQCPANATEQGVPTQRTSWVIAIFSATTGALERFIPLDPLLGVEGRALTVARYASLGWSPDGQRLAVIYTLFSARAG